MDSATRFFVAAFACSFLIVAPASAQLTLTNNSGQATAETQYGAGSFLSPQTVTTSFGPDGGVALSHLDLRSFGRGEQRSCPLLQIPQNEHLARIAAVDQGCNRLRARRDFSSDPSRSRAMSN